MENIKCALSPGALEGRLIDLITQYQDNPTTPSNEELYTKIFDIMYTVNGTNLAASIKESSESVLFSYLEPTISFLQESKESIYTELIAGELLAHTIKKLDLNHKTTNQATKEVNPTNEQGESSSDGDSVEDAFLGNSLEKTLEDIGNLRGDKEIKRDDSAIAFLYFGDGREALHENFTKFFMDTYYKAWIDKSVNGDGYTIDLNKVLVKLQNALSLEAAKLENYKGTSTQAMLDSEEITNAYYAYVASKELSSMINLHLTGLEVTGNVLKISEDKALATHRVGSVEDAGGLDQGTPLINLHISSTPRLNKNADGTFTRDKNLPFLSRRDIAYVAEELGKIGNYNFERKLKKLARESNDTEKSVIFNSLYQNFFASDSYKVDNKESLSLSKVKNHENLKKHLAAIKTFITSNKVKSTLSSRNKKVMLNSSQNESAVQNLNNTFNVALSRPNSSAIKSEFINKISYHYDEENKYITVSVVLTSNKITSFNIKPTSNQTSGVVVKLEGEQSDTFEGLDNIARLLQAFNFPANYTKKDFLQYYQDNIKNIQETSTNSVSLQNLAANVVFMVALNDPAFRLFLDENKFSYPKISEEVRAERVNTKELLYPPFLSLRNFITPLAAYSEKLTGASAPKVVQNVNGDMISTTGVRSTFSDIITRIDQLEEITFSDNMAMHANNGFTNGKYTLVELASKDGKTLGDKKRPNKSFTKREHFSSMLIDYYLLLGAKSNYKNSAFQAATFSDRTDVPVCVVSINQGSFADVDKLVTVKDGMTRGQQEVFNYQRGYHNQVQNAILTVWKQQLDLYVAEGAVFASDYLNLNTLRQLQDFLVEANIPLSKVRESTLLGAQFAYAPNSDLSKPALLKELLLQSHDIWTNEAAAKAWMNSEYRNFAHEVKMEFNEKNLTGAERIAMAARFSPNSQVTSHKENFDKMLKSYFYDNLAVTRPMLDMLAGHLHQFKGDIRPMDKEFEFREKYKIKNPEITTEELDTLVKENELQHAITSAVIDQSKRMAMFTSGYQRPELIDTETKGKSLGLSSKVILIDDPKLKVQVLGDLRGDLEQEMFDGAMGIHPLELLKTNNSFGGNVSAFFSAGAPLKTISLMYNKLTGESTGQKKAEFSLFTNELLKKSPSLQRLFRKMNSTVSFNTPIETTDNNGETIIAYNIHDLWTAFGSFNNEYAWEEVLEILSEIPVERDNYIAKFGFLSGEKFGNRGVNTADVWRDNSTPLIYTEFDNTSHGIILQVDHDTDVSEEASKSLMTQLIAAINFEGNSLEVANQVNDSLGTLSNLGLDSIKNDLYDTANEMLTERLFSLGLDTVRTTEINKLLTATSFSESQQNSLSELYKDFGILDLDEVSGDAVVEYARRETEKAINARDSGQLSQLVSPEVSALDTLQLSSVVHSAIMAIINVKCNKLKFSGGELVVAPGNEFLELYPVAGTNKRVTRAEYVELIFNSGAGLELVSTQEQLDNIPDGDTILFNGEQVLAIEVKKELEAAPDWFNDLAYNLQIVTLPEASTLEWMQYTGIVDGVRKNLKEFPIYQALLDNAAELKLSKDDAGLQAQRFDLMSELDDLMKNEAYAWETIAAEVFMPSMHAASFDLYEDALDNLESSSGEILSVYNESTGAYSGLNITDITGFDQYGNKYYVKNGKVVAAGTKNAVLVFESEISSMVKFFTERIESNPYKYNLNDFVVLDGILNINETREFANSISNKIDRLESGPHKDALQTQLNATNSIIEKYSNTVITDDMLITESDLEIINNSLVNSEKSYIAALALKKAYTFPQSLDVFIARVPGQSKQSGVPAKIKGFVFSTRNSIYAAVDLLTVSGADHDVDKVHTLVYSLDRQGNIFSYEEYLDVNGKISKEKYKEILSKKLADTSIRLISRGVTGKDLNKVLAKIRKEELYKFSEGIKNFVVEKLREVYGDPKNAIEAATPMTMEKLKASIIGEWVVEATEDGDVVVNSGRISAFSPASVMALERANAVGKDGISIFATGLKGYAAIFNTRLNDQDGFMTFSSEYSRVGLDHEGKEDKELSDIYKEEYGHNLKGVDQSLVLYSPDRSAPAISTDISGANQWKKGELENRFSHAWRALSELLSAATDNAKELILSKIGADSTTSGTIAAAVIIGFPIDNVLNIFKTKTVTDLVVKANDEADIVLNPSGYAKSFSAVVKEDWKKRGPGVIKSVKDSHIKYKKALLQSNRSYLSAQEIVSGLDGSISSLSLAAPTGYNGTSDLNVEIGSTDNNFDLLLQTSLELAGNASLINTSDISRVSLMNTLIGAKTIVLKQNSDDPALQKIAENYAIQNNITLYKVTEGNWTLNGEVTRPIFSGKVALVGNIKTTRVRNNTDENIKSALEDTRLAFKDQVAYDQKITLQIEARANDLELKKKNFDMYLDAYLSDGARQLIILDKIGSELKGVTSFLSINGGNPNSEFDVHSYYKKISKAIEKSSNNEMSMSVVEVEKFISDLNNGNIEAAQVKIDAFETYKTGFNPLYVMANSPHYLAQVEALDFGKKLVNGATFTNKKVIELISKFRTSSLSEKFDYNEGKGVINSLTIDYYLKSRNKSAVVYGQEFDLTTIEGRELFVSYLPTLLPVMQSDEKLKNNLFVRSLNLDSRFNYQTNKKEITIRADNLNYLDASKKAGLQLNLSQLLQLGADATNLHEALYLYGLITNKGGRSASDFVSLFDYKNTVAYKEYVESQKELNSTNIISDTINSKTSKGEVNDSMETQIASELLMPRSMAVVDTSLRESDIPALPEGMEQDPDSNNGPLLPTKIYVHDNNQKKLKVPAMGPRNYTYKSAQTGKIYVWDTRSSSYEVVSQKYPSNSLPIEINNEKSNNALSGTNYQWGYTVEIDSEKKTGQVLKYAKSEGGYKVALSSGEEIIMTAAELTSLNPDMLFSKHNFGYILDADRQKRDTLSTNNVTNNYAVTMTREQLTHLKNRPYFVRQNLSADDGAFFMLNQVVQKLVISGLEVEKVYKGIHNSRDAVVRHGLDSRSKRIGEDEQVHIFEYRLVNRPISVSRVKMNETIMNRVVGGKTSIALTQIPLQMATTVETVVLYNNQYYKITRLGNFSNVFGGQSDNSILNKLGYTPSPFTSTLLNKFKSNDKSGNVYSITPFNATAGSTNSYVEYNKIKNTPTTENLMGKSLSVVTDANNESSIAKSFGINYGFSDSIDETAVAETLEYINEDESENNEQPTVKYADHVKRQLTAITSDSNDMIVMVTAFQTSRITIRDKSLISFLELYLESVDVTTTFADTIKSYLGSTNEFSNQVDLANFISLLQNSINDIQTKANDNSLFEQLKKFGYNNPELNLTSALEALNKEKISNELKSIALGEDFIPLQAAKRQNKPLFVYNPLVMSWFKYDSDSGNMVKSVIPEINTPKNSVLVLGSKNKATALDALLRKTSLSIVEQNSFSHDMISSSELSLPSEVSGLVTAISTDISGLDLIVPTQSVDDFEDTTLVNDTYMPTDSNGIMESDFLESDISFTSYADGAFSIEFNEDGDDRFLVGFSDESLRATYADYKGSSTVENMRLKVGDKYYTFPQLQNTNPEAFARRDLFLNEKIKLNSLQAEANNIFKEKIQTLYNSLRYGNFEASIRFQDYSNFEVFMKYADAGNIKFNADETIIYNELKAERVSYDKALREVNNFTAQLNEKYFKFKPKVNITNSTFNQLGDQTVYVYIDATANQLEKTPGRPFADTVTNSFSLPVISDNGTDYEARISDPLTNKIKELIKLAKENPDSKFLFDLPGNADSFFMKGLKNSSVWRTISEAIHRQGTLIEWPSNLLFSGSGAEYLNNNRGGFSVRALNTVVPYSFIADPFDKSSGYNVTNLAYTLKFKSGLSINDLINSTIGANHEKIWNSWFEENPELGEQLARSIGSKPMYDASFIKNKFSDVNITGAIVAKILNNKYVSNDWIYYDQVSLNKHNIILSEGQYRMPLLNSDISWDKSLPVIVEISGKKYVATVVGDSFIHPGFSQSELIGPMAIPAELSMTKFISDTYGVKSTDSYSIISLTEFKNTPLKDVKVEPGTFSKALKQSDVTVSGEFMELADKATRSIGWDVSSKLVDNNADSPFFNNPRLEKLKSVMGSGVTVNFNADDKVHLWGSTLEDGVSLSTLNDSFDLHIKSLLHRMINAKAEILVGKNSGMDERVRSYIKNNPSFRYTETPTGFKSGSVERQFKYQGGKFTGFNQNFSVQRFNLNEVSYVNDGPEGVEIEINSSLDDNFTIDLAPEQILNWLGEFNPEEISTALTRNFNVAASDNSLFTVRLRKELISKEQKYMRRAVGARLMKEIPNLNLNTLKDFDETLMDLRNDPVFEANYVADLSLIFDDTLRFKDISDIGALAMARSHQVTVGYMKEIFPNDDFEAGAVNKMLSFDRTTLDKSEDYKKIMNDPYITESDLSLIKQSKNVTNRDAYNFLKTIGNKKIVDKGSKIRAVLVNKYFLSKGISAFSTSKGITVFDMDSVINNNSANAKEFFNKSTFDYADYDFNDTEIKLMEIDRSFSAYLFKNDLAVVDEKTNQLVLSLDSGEFRYDLGNNQNEKTLNKNVSLQLVSAKIDVLHSALNNIKGLQFDRNDVVNNFNASKENQVPNFNKIIFSSTKNISSALFQNTKTVLSEDMNKNFVGKSYFLKEGEIDKVFLFLYDEKITMLKENGEVLNYNNESKTWEKSSIEVALDYSGFSLNRNLATPENMDTETLSLLTTTGSIDRGVITVTRNGDTYLAENNTNGNFYTWQAEANSWSLQGSDDSIALNLNPDSNVVAGQRVNVINGVGGLSIVLDNGVAISETVIQDDYAKYTKGTDNLWSIEPTPIGGFNNNEIRFQKAKVVYTNSKGKVLASKKATPTVVDALANFFTEKLGLNIEVLSSLDIASDERFQGARFRDAAGFVYKGQVFLNSDKATLDTPVHEILGHVFLENLKISDFNLYSNIIEMSLAETGIKEQILSEYPELENDPEGLAGEIFSFIVGLESQTLTEKLLAGESNLNLWQKIKKLVTEFMSGSFSSMFNVELEISEKDTLAQIIAKLNEDTLYGEGSIFNKFRAETKKDISTILSPEILEEEIINHFQDNGWIKQICTNG